MRIRLLVAFAALVLALPLGTASAQPRDPGPPRAGHEIWALDQGLDMDRIHVYGEDLVEITTIELGGIVETPHMIDFDSSYRYAFVASTRSGNVAVIRTADYQVIDVIATGATAHMAAVTPDDSAIWVANIGARTFTEIVPDWEAEEFTLGRELDVTTDPIWQQEFGAVSPPPAPVCHEYTRDGRHAYLTLGPGPGGLVIVDVASEQPRIVKAFPREQVKANCGLARSPHGQKMYANWGSPAQTEEAPGEWYVFNTARHTWDGVVRSTRGVDAHGVRITPNGRELWQVNRGTGNAIVVDTATDSVIDELDFGGDAPDILDFSPDGSRAYGSLRGPNPRSGDPHVATGTTPGFAVVDVASRELLSIVQPAEGDERSDFHGIGVRVIHDLPRAPRANQVAPVPAPPGG